MGDPSRSVTLCPSSSRQAWTRLEKAEHEREVALRNELIRQEKLELLAQRFDHKAVMRETWLNENQRLVSQVRRAERWGTRVRGGGGRIADDRGIRSCVAL